MFVGSFQLTRIRRRVALMLSREDRKNILEALLVAWEGCVEDVIRVFRRVFKYRMVFGAPRGICLGVGCVRTRVFERHYPCGSGTVDF